MKLFAVLGLLVASSAAHAGFIATNTGLASTQSASGNHFSDSLSTLGISSYSLGTSLGVTTDGFVTYYYYGKVAAYDNRFTAGGLSYSTGYDTPLQQSAFGAPIEIGNSAVTAGLLNFDFCAFGYDASNLGCVNNAANTAMNLNSSQAIAMNITDGTAWLFWDDSGGAPDDDYDDMIVKAVFRPATAATAVPEPSSLTLMGLGLLAAAFALKKRTAKT